MGKHGGIAFVRRWGLLQAFQYCGGELARRNVNGKRRAVRGVGLTTAIVDYGKVRRVSTAAPSVRRSYLPIWLGAGPNRAATSGSRVTGLRFTRMA